MNPDLTRLQPYPFERLNALKAGISPPDELTHISLAMGEPRHSPPSFLVERLADRQLLRDSLTRYPTTPGSISLREAMSDWCNRRFSLTDKLDPNNQILPLQGTREGLFSFAQAVLSGAPKSRVIMPNPFYQIYEGAALLRGAIPYYLTDNGNNEPYSASLERVPEEVWQNCELMYVCNPGNPTGRVLSLQDLRLLIELSQRYEFILASDECYSEIYLDEECPPSGLLQACCKYGNRKFKRCVVFNSLSKRSNLPGLRSGFIAGDASVLQAYLTYRTYQGGAMPLHVQAVSGLAWQDEDHVRHNRTLYRQKFQQVTPRLKHVMDVQTPAASFFLWAAVPGGNDEEFTRELYRARNVTVLPGSYLSRCQNGVVPGRGYVRLALVAELDSCIEAAERIVDFLALYVTVH